MLAWHTVGMTDLVRAKAMELVQAWDNKRFVMFRYVKALRAALDEPAPQSKLHYSGPASRAFWKAVDGLKEGAWNEAYASGVELQNMEERVLKMLPPAPETAIGRRPVELVEDLIEVATAAETWLGKGMAIRVGNPTHAALTKALDALRAERGSK